MASTAALFDRQQLESREDMLMLGQILNDVMQNFIEVRIYLFQSSRFVFVCCLPNGFFRDNHSRSSSVFVPL